MICYASDVYYEGDFIVLIWNVHWGRFGASAVTVETMPRLASAPLMMPQGVASIWSIASLSIWSPLPDLDSRLKLL